MTSNVVSTSTTPPLENFLGLLSNRWKTNPRKYACCAKHSAKKNNRALILFLFPSQVLSLSPTQKLTFALTDAMRFRFLKTYVLPILAEQRFNLCTSIFLVFCTSLLASLSLEAGRSVLQVVRVSAQEIGQLSFFVSHLAQWGGLNHHGLFFTVSAIALLLPVFASASTFWRDLYFEKISVEITKQLRQLLFTHCIRMRYADYKQQEQGKSIKRIIYDAAITRELIVNGILLRISDGMTFLVVMAYLFFLMPALASISLLVSLTYLLFSIWSAGKAQSRLVHSDRSFENLTVFSQDSLKRVLDIKVNQRERYEEERFGEFARKEAQNKLRTIKWLLLDKNITGFLHSFGPLLITLIGGWYVMDGRLQFESLVVFTAANALLYSALDDLAAIPLIIQRATIAIKNIQSIFDYPVENLQSSTSIQIPSLTRDSPLLSVNDLCFGYLSTSLIVQRAHLCVNKGEVVGLVGKSGCGKSTLLYLIHGLYGGYEGSIHFKGIPLEQMSLTERRASIRLLTPDANLFPGTLLENAVYSIDDEQLRNTAPVLDVLSEVGLDKELLEDSITLDLQLGPPSGRDLSTGQQRRLLFSRAILGPGELYLLDEPDANISEEDRLRLYQAIRREATKGKSFLVTTHNETHLGLFDKVYRLDKKPIVAGDDVETSSYLFM